MCRLRAGEREYVHNTEFATEPHAQKYIPSIAQRNGYRNVLRSHHIIEHAGYETYYTEIHLPWTDKAVRSTQNGIDARALGLPGLPGSLMLFPATAHSSMKVA